MSATPVSSTPQSYAEQISALFSSYMGRAITCLQDAGSYILTTITAIWNRATQWFSPASSAPVDAPPARPLSSSTATASPRVALPFQNHTLLLEFYSGTAPNAHGVTLEQILARSDEELFDTADYASWCFPCNRGKEPRLDQQLIAAFQANRALKVNLVRSLERMLRFYGLNPTLTADPLPKITLITPAANFAERSAIWTHPDPNNHHLQTITRILISLSLLRLTDHAAKFYKSLKMIAATQAGAAIPAEKLKEWKKECRAHL